MTKPNDDLEATRQIAALLEPFELAERERIIRWVREKLGMMAVSTQVAPVVASLQPTASGTQTVQLNDLRSFVKSKSPKNDMQFTATVAYYHRFLAPEGSRKDAISPQDLLDACRIADWKRPARPRQTMLNAFSAGVFDKSGHGSYKLNSVGENLVAMVLPGDGAHVPPSIKPARKTKIKSKSRKRAKR